MRIGLTLLKKQLLKRSMSRLSLVFPNHSKKWIQLLAIDNFRHASWFAAEFLKDLSPFTSHKNVKCRIVNQEILTETLSKRKHVVCFMSHSYNFESILSQLHLFGPAEYCFIYQPIHDLPILDRIIRWKRERHTPHIKLLPADDPLRITRYVLSKKNHSDSLPIVLGVVGDVRGSETSPTIEFLSSSYPMIVGSEKIGSMINAEFLYISSHSIRRGFHEFSIKRLPEDTHIKYHYTRMFYQILEQDVIDYPADWLLWNQMN